MIITVDTIVACATPPGRGGVGIVRVSGPAAPKIAQAVLGCVPPIRQATYLPFLNADRSIIDQGIVIVFEAPHSFTGEAVVEFQGHGGMVVIDQLIKRILEEDGVRLARPGEFSERAFLNDKIDLVQAEAIADLIDATSTQAVHSAMKSLQGEFSKKVKFLVERLIALRLYVEAAIDFPEEEVDFLSDGKVKEDLDAVIHFLALVLSTAKQGALLRDGVSVVIAGKPNVGKSSLLNLLSGRDSAIVTDIPGTTRDVLREYIHLDGMPLHIIDTAGLRDSDDVVEQMGVSRATAEINQADIVLLMVDSSVEKATHPQILWPKFLEYLPPHAKLMVVSNKIDINHSPAGIAYHEGCPVVSLSVKENRGVEALIDTLKTLAGFEQFGENTFMARGRHVAALQRAMIFLQRGQDALTSQKAGELLADDLRGAQTALSDITGEFTSDDLLGEIFSSFCIGK